MNAHDCIHQEDFQALYTQTNRMDKNITRIIGMLEAKKDKDTARNGRIKDIGDKAEAADKGLEERVTNLEKAVIRIATQQTDDKELLTTIVSLLKAIAVGFVVFFLTFAIKTFVWGF